MPQLLSAYTDRYVLGSISDEKSSEKASSLQKNDEIENSTRQEQISLVYSLDFRTYSLDIGYSENHNTKDTHNNIYSNLIDEYFFNYISNKNKDFIPKITFNALQEWEGYILEIGDEKFTARLLDLTADASLAEEEAEIPLSEISKNDRDQIGPGSIFRWSIGYERSLAGTKKRVSHIVFRDIPALSKLDMIAGARWAEEISKNIQVL